MAVRLTIDIRLQRAAEQAIREGIALAKANKQYNVAGGAIIALDPRDGAVRAMASYPDLQAVGLRRPHRPEEARAAREQRRRQGGELPRPQPGHAGRLPAGLGLEASHGARGDAGASPLALLVDSVHAVCRVRPRQAGLQELGPVREPADEPPRGARDVLRHVLLHVGNRFYEGGKAEQSRLQQWARKFGFGAPTGLDIGNEAPSWQTVVPTPAWRKRTFKSDWDKAWNPGNSIQLAIGQQDVT